MFGIDIRFDVLMAILHVVAPFVAKWLRSESSEVCKCIPVEVRELLARLVESINADEPTIKKTLKEAKAKIAANGGQV